MERRTNFNVLGSERVFFEPPDSTIGIRNRDISPNKYREFSPSQRFEMRLIRSQILEIFGVSNLSEIPDLSKNSEKRQEIRTRFINIYGNMYGLDDKTFDEKEKIIKRAVEEADVVMNIMENQENGKLKRYRDIIGTIAEVQMVKDPIDLLFLAFSRKQGRRARYEARRKLILTDLAMQVLVYNSYPESALGDFVEFLRDRIWETPLGLMKNINVVSTHSDGDFNCEEVRICCDTDRVPEVRSNQIVTNFSMRAWKDRRGKKRYVELDQRKKGIPEQIIKMLRKSSRDPALIDDMLGLRLIFLTKEDLFEFISVLQTHARQHGSLMDFFNVQYSLDKKEKYKPVNQGSSSEYEVAKAQIRFHGSVFEIQLHTISSYLNSKYKKGVAMNEYSISRLRDVFDLFYPHDMYPNFDADQVIARIIEDEQLNVQRILGLHK